jgi:HD-GYP domain-containing protein (c-di-GMP phosphodiesterase class II)
MMNTTTNVISRSSLGPRQRSSPIDDLTPILGRIAAEFSAPVGLFSSSACQWRGVLGGDWRGFPTAERAARAMAEIEPGRVDLWRDDHLPGPVWLVIPWVSDQANDEPLLAWVGFATSADAPNASVWGPLCPDPALKAWGQAVANRLLRKPAVVSSSGSALSQSPRLTDRLIRQLRVSDPPERFQHLAADVVRADLGVEAVAWVPHNPKEPVVVAGHLDGLTTEHYRSLVPSTEEEAARLANRLSTPHPLAARRIAIVAADRQNPVGWFLALNTNDDRPFSSAEIEVLQPVAALIATQRSNARLYGDLKDLLFGVIRSLTSAIDAKDPYTSGHSERVARIAVRLGEALGMSLTQRGDLYLMGLLHDVGKIGIDDSVLKKQGRLTSEEFRQIQSHVRIGMHILSDLKKLQHLLPGVAHHHEALDGSGYPLGLSGDEIPLPARILAVADAFDAMSSSRPYRRRMSSPQIDDEFRKGTGTQWDPRVVAALFSCRDDIDRIRQKGLGESLHQVVDDTLGRE